MICTRSSSSTSTTCTSYKLSHFFISRIICSLTIIVYPLPPFPLFSVRFLFQPYINVLLLFFKYIPSTFGEQSDIGEPFLIVPPFPATYSER